MAKRSNAKRIERLEDICIGAGFLLMKLNMQFGNAMGEGMRQQVHQCIQDCNAVARAAQQRENAKAEGEL